MLSPRVRSLANARDFVEMFALADSGMISEPCFAEDEKLLQRRNLAWGTLSRDDRGGQFTDARVG
ncbi:hypothetical protein HRbin30_00477 [bacterium HR30]|nr:hypothetical protein HRbin30_00477 [bacterium HR30]